MADKGVADLIVVRPGPPVPSALGLLADSATVVAAGGFRMGRRGLRIAGQVARAVPVPRPSPTSRAGRRMDDVTYRASQVRRSLEQSTAHLLDRLVPAVFDAILDRTDLTQIVRDRVDVDQIVAVVDIDAAATRIDLDAIAKRLDIEAIIGRLDLVALTREIMDALDIPELIRESTTSVASGSVTEVRLQSISADEAVARVVDRFRFRRRPAPPKVPPTAPSEPAAPT
jgi:hypothetical protein